MNYKKIYYDMIESRRNIIIKNNIYTEQHHILPKCLGGSNLSDNMIRLSYKDHYMAHLLLYKMANNLNEKYRLSAALAMLCKSNNGLRNTSSRRYESSMRRYKDASIEYLKSPESLEMRRASSTKRVKTITDRFIYLFYHEVFGKFEGSAFNLMNKFPDQKLNSGNLVKVGKSIRLNHKGWMLFSNKHIGMAGFEKLTKEKQSYSAKLRECPTKGKIILWSPCNGFKKYLMENSKKYYKLIDQGFYSKNGKHGNNK